jgi:hypothetical protein
MMAQSRHAQTEITELHAALARSEAKISKLQVQTAADAGQSGTKRLESSAPKLIAAEPPANPPISQPLALSEDDIATVRQFIKTVASHASGPSVRVGDPVGQLPTAAVPQPLAEALPKLAGGRFLIDDTGAVVIIAKGSNAISTIVPPR